MNSRVDPQLLQEVAAFALRYGCEDCAHFAVTQGACAHGYPNEAHRLQPLERLIELTFCKEFELV